MQLDAKRLLLLGLAIAALYYLIVLIKAIKSWREVKPTATGVGIGALTDFLDALGIGSFATTTALFRATKSVRDDLMPGTLNAAHTFATITQAFIYTQLVDVETTTLVGMIAAAVLGAWLGAGIVAKWPTRWIQLGMGICLIVAAALTVAQVKELLPGGGTAAGVEGIRLVAALVGNFLLGALMTIGIGLYGPCMILVSLLGMDPKVAFPVMMGSCAFLMPLASARFLRLGKVDLKAVVSLTLGGVPAVFVAAFIVKSLPLTALRWLVVVVVLYTAVTLLMAARRGTPQQDADAITA